MSVMSLHKPNQTTGRCKDQYSACFNPIHKVQPTNLGADLLPGGGGVYRAQDRTKLHTKGCNSRKLSLRGFQGHCRVIPTTFLKSDPNCI